MRSQRLSRTILLLLLSTLLIGGTEALAATRDDDDDADEYDVTARVMRVSLLSGEVSLRRAGNKNWESARLNFPLVEGDTLATGSDGRAEIQIDARNFMRLSENSVLRIVTLRDEGIALSLSEGRATLRIARFDHEREYFEVDAPKTTLAVEKRGLYRLDVGPGGGVQITVRDDGRARIYSETSGFTLRDGRSATLSETNADEGDWELGYASARDSWDDWVNERERYLNARLRYDDRTRYYDADVWGAEDLDAYGDWSYANNYGWVWRPRVTVINNYYDWAPYRYGRWVWCPPYGWTWVGDEPWGWAPYHYGRWVYYNNNWCWAPRGYGFHYKRSYWRPALVAFVYLPTSYGEHVAWYPLTYGQHDPHSRRYQQQREPARLTPLRADELARLQRINPAALRAVTTTPARNFGTDEARAQAAPAELARRAVAGEPVRGRLPITPADAQTNNAGATERPARNTGAARPASSTSAGLNALPERPTGAAARRAGVPLDEELRRTRVYNGREPRVVSGSDSLNGSGVSVGTTTGPDTRDARDARETGAVARPARPGTARPNNRVDERGTNDDEGAATRPARPARNLPPNTGTNDGERNTERNRAGDVERNRDRNWKREPERDTEERGPARRPPVSSTTEETPSSQPAERPRTETPARPVEEERPRVRERPEVRERDERRERPEKYERPERDERRERAEPPARREAPAQRSEPPAPRAEPRTENRPEPRQEQRQEQPREQPAPSRAPESPKPSGPERGREAPARPARGGKERDDPRR